MQYLLKGLYTEWLKARRSFVVVYVILCPFILSLLLFLVYANRTIISQSEIQPPPMVNHWEEMLLGAYIALTNVFLVLFVALLQSMLYTREHQGNMWKHLYSLPVPRWTVFGAKSLFSILLLAISLASYVLMLVAAAYLLDVVRPKVYNFAIQDHFFGRHCLMSFRILLSALGLWAIHNWLSLRFKGVGLSMGIAIVSIIISPIALSSMSRLGDWVYLYPYLYPYHVVLDFMSSNSNRLSNIWQPETYGSIAYAAIFVCLGYWEYHRNRHK